MKHIHFLIILLLLSCQPKVRYVTYHNERFGFELVYPSFMTKDPPPQNGDGVHCHGNGLTLTAFGGMDLDSTNSFKEDGIFQITRVVDSAGMVHCEKAAHFSNTDNGNVIIRLLLTYPEGETDQEVVDVILDSFMVTTTNL